MNTEVLHDVTIATQQGKITFPQAVGKLLQAGVESYYVDLIAGRKTYYSAAGETFSEPMILKLDPVAENFSENDLIAALGASQADAIRYPEFVRRATAAGVTAYRAFLTGRQVVYLGHKGETYIRKFPGAK